VNINNPTTFSAPDLTLGTSNSSGSAGALRADDTILVYDTTLPDAIAYGQSGSAGDSSTAARRNHSHAMAASPVETSGYADVTTQQTTSSNSFTDLTTAGPAITLSPGSTQNYIIWVACSSKTDHGDQYAAFMGVSIAGAAAVNANAGASYTVDLESNCWPVLATSVADGSTHTAKYRVENSSATGNYIFRRILATTT